MYTVHGKWNALDDAAFENHDNVTNISFSITGDSGKLKSKGRVLTYEGHDQCAQWW